MMSDQKMMLAAVRTNLQLIVQRWRQSADELELEVQTRAPLRQSNEAKMARVQLLRDKADEVERWTKPLCEQCYGVGEYDRYDGRVVECTVCSGTGGAADGGGDE